MGLADTVDVNGAPLTYGPPMPVAPMGPLGLASTLPPLQLAGPPAGPPPLSGPPMGDAADQAVALHERYQREGNALPVTSIPSPMLNPSPLKAADPLMAVGSRFGGVTNSPEAPEAGPPAGGPSTAIAPPPAMQLTPPRYIPPGYDDRRNPWRKSGQERFFEADGREKGALDEQARLAAGDQLRSAALTEDLAGQIKVQEDATRLAEARRQDEARQREAQVTTLVDDVQSSKIDPGRFYSSMSVGAQASSIIAAALQGAANGLMGRGGNEMLTRLDALNAQDIDAQKGTLAAKQSALSGRQNLLQQMRARFGDERQAEIGAKLALYEGAKLKAQQYASASGSEMTMKKAEGLIAELDKRTELLKRDLVDTPSYRPGQMVGGGKGGLSEKDQARYVPAAGGLARTEKEAGELRAVSSSVATIRALVKEARTLRDDPKSFVPGTDANARLKGIAASLTLEGKTANELGAISGPDMGLLNDLSGNVTSVLPGVSAQLEAMGSRAEAGLQRKFQNQGIQQVQTGYGVDATGQLKPKASYTGKDTKPIKGFKGVGQ